MTDKPNDSDEASALRIPLSEERAVIEKRTVLSGRVRVHTEVEHAQEFATGTLREESVEVTRVPIDRYVDRAPEVRTEGDLTIVPLVEEVLVVEKRLLLKEELHVRKRVKTEEVSVPVDVRRQRGLVERLDPSPAEGGPL